MKNQKIRIKEISALISSKKLSLPLFTSSVQAGFPSPTDDYIEDSLDLNQLMIKHPSATFFVRVEGDSMIGAGIHSGDILVVDRSLEPISGKIIVAIVNGEFTVKRLLLDKRGAFLLPENASYRPIKIEPETEFQVWGIVTYVIHKVNGW